MRALASLAVVTSLLVPFAARASAERYGVRLPPDGLVVDVPYTLGTHHEHVTEVHGIVQLDPEALRLDGGRLVVPIAAFRSDDAQRGCHLREALGLDYARSRFPAEHVCDDANRLPASGPDAIAFPDIVLDLDRATATTASPGGASAVELDGRLSVHGVSRPVRIELAVSRDAPPGMLRVRGKVPLRLSDFDVTVKPASVLFVTISVRNEVTVEIDALLEPLRRQ